ncbi:uncharacterized protein ATNIH1004_004954 [Aspergillus tanneri]|uniref:Transcription factor domain-containing protein n=1 Tax=Aspergillus tanneri TaxID=1220188 RepID=A0A5M9MPP1_9EURO|nr:uncharacterized protein ATNIH1004_004954 [Aspergillus tanneri]KAA8649062.1 hypothetical protein ATNIH1004_004954 [Aspergillus tanneri]
MLLWTRGLWVLWIIDYRSPLKSQTAVITISTPTVPPISPGFAVDETIALFSDISDLYANIAAGQLDL